jgi:hypothetical protein
MHAVRVLVKSSSNVLKCYGPLLKPRTTVRRRNIQKSVAAAPPGPGRTAPFAVLPYSNNLDTSAAYFRNAQELAIE